MMEWRLRAEGLPLDHPAGVILCNRAVSSQLAVTQIAGKTAEPAGVVITVIYYPVRWVGHGLDGASQVVGLLHGVGRSPRAEVEELL